MYDYENEPRGNFLCVDLKSFYASCECQARGLNPMTTLLVVMSRAENTGNGLVLAASPQAKKELGISNVTRADQLPPDDRLIIVSPRMNYYIKMNTKVNTIFREFVADEDLLEYSIDESFLNLTPSLHYFKKTPQQLAVDIQTKIYSELGLFSTVGLGDNPLLAKIAMDIEAKHTRNMFAEWRYEDVQEKLWEIKPLSEFWGIGRRLEKRLNDRGIMSMGDLAHYNPYLLKQTFGVIGEQLFAHSWGVDRTSFKETLPTRIKEKSIGNSQVLPKDYTDRETLIVLRELSEQVATRLRSHNVQTTVVHLGIGYSYNSPESGFSRQQKISATNRSKPLSEAVFQLFHKFYTSGCFVRNISISCGGLVESDSFQFSLFEEPEQQLKEAKIDSLIDDIRNRFGFTSIVHGYSALEAGTAIKRASLVGGHAGGNEGMNQGGASDEY